MQNQSTNRWEINNLIEKQTVDLIFQESTGNFKKNKIEPKENKMVITDFTKTVQKWINPYNKDKNEVHSFKYLLTM